MAAAEAPVCPEPVAGTALLKKEALGYCFLYPEEYFLVEPLTYEICLVPQETKLLCHSFNLILDVHAAGGTTAEQVADEMVASASDPGLVTRSSLTVGGEQAAALDGLPGQAATHNVVVVHDDRRYQFTFALLDEADPEFEKRKALYDTVIDSFTFIPAVAEQAASAAGGSAIVAFVKDGNLLVWEAAASQSRTISDTGDAVRVELSDDGELAAFVRRAYFAAGDYDRHEMSSLWVVGLDGENPRQIVSAEALRLLVGAAEAESTNFPRLQWVPKSHRLLFSGNKYEAHGYGEGAHTPVLGVYMVDADSPATATLAPASESHHFIPSPDGRLAALITNEHIRFTEVETGRTVLDFPVTPVVGETGWFTNAGAWTQDARSFVINALVEPRSNTESDYEIWRIPVNGSPAGRLESHTAGGGTVLYAPDGSRIAYPSGTTGLQGERISNWLIAPLAVSLGPLAVPVDSFDYSHLSWSPDGWLYAWDLSDRARFFQLCPNAVQEIEACGSPVDFKEPIEWFEWVGRDHYLYVTQQPRRLFLGALDGSAIEVAADPQSFAAVTGACRNDAEFIADITVPDGTPFASGVLFIKTWRVRNSGTCAWDPAYRLTFLAGDRMDGPRSLPLGDVVEPGMAYDLSVTLIAPRAPGTYQGQWQMFGPDGRPFGTAPYVAIQVP